MENWQKFGFAVYIHWPYCAAKCPYCDFNSYVASMIDHVEWQAAFTSEIDRYGKELPDRYISSVFFGGGTPSLMDPSVVDAILSRISKTWSVANDIEISLEANPTSVEASLFKDFQSAGVNRVSIGIQALNDTDLKSLGRLHSVNEGLRAIDIAHKHFDSVSFDLIYARQNQTLDAWSGELQMALDLNPSHLSLYQLTIEEGTVFGDRFARGKLRGLPSDDLAADLYATTQELCMAAGLPPYEISNHAVHGKQSRHNLTYWNCGDYLGIGPGAHGRVTINRDRYATETALAPKDWLNAACNGNGEAARTKISAVEDQQERLLMGLRLVDGIEVSDPLRQELCHDKITDLLKLGLISYCGSWLSITESGRPLTNAILRELI